VIKHAIGIAPTYNRPAAAANAVAQWLDQDCDLPRSLIVFDDAGQFDPQSHDQWQLVSWHNRCETLGEKFDIMLRQSVGLALERRWNAAETLIVVWEDDDVYLPDHVQRHVDAIESTGKQWSAPSRIWANDAVGYGNRHISDARGRHHGAWAFMLTAAIEAGGYPHCNGDANGAGFDLIFGARMRTKWGEPADTTPEGTEPHYLYRWFTAGRNGSAFGAAHMMEYQGAPEYLGELTPQFDGETRIYWGLQ
jgi:hypothetical protein